MPPKKKFTRQQIIDAAFAIARNEGLDGITIRKVADSLGSSIAPIYVNFNDIEELKQAVIEKTFGLAQQLLAEQTSPSPFANIALASLRFAKEYSMLFRDLVMKQNPYMREHEPPPEVMVELMKEDPELTGFNDEELATILSKMRIFQLGLSVMYANDLLPADITEEDLLKILSDAGDDIITATRIRKQKGDLKND